MKRSSDQLEQSSSAKSSEAPSRVEVSSTICDQCIYRNKESWKPKQILLRADQPPPDDVIQIFHTSFDKEDKFRAKVYLDIVKPGLEGLVSSWEILVEAVHDT